MEFQTGRVVEVKGFDTLKSEAAYGGTDAAYLYGSSGGDTYYSIPDYSLMPWRSTTTGPRTRLPSTAHWR